MSPDGQSLLDEVRLFSPYLSQVLQQQPLLAEEIFIREGYRTRLSRNQLAQKLRGQLDGREDSQVFGLSRDVSSRRRSCILPPVTWGAGFP